MVPVLMLVLESENKSLKISSCLTFPQIPSIPHRALDEHKNLKISSDPSSYHVKQSYTQKNIFTTVIDGAQAISEP